MLADRKDYHFLITIKTIINIMETNKLLSLKKEISNLELQIKAKRDEINKELSQIGDIVKELAVYIKLNNYPTEIYPVFSFDEGEYDKYKNIELKIVDTWGYTDVVGLTKEEFKRLEDILASEN